MSDKFRTFYAFYEEWVKLKQRRIASSGEYLANRLAEEPSVAKEWPPKKWSNLVAAKPEFADRCPWELFDGANWAHLLCFQPQFADRKPKKSKLSRTKKAPAKTRRHLQVPCHTCRGRL